ncbi:type II/IV secretion system protein [bacterium]|nr:type II/IV secretion system protein [bacterium]
MSAKWIFPLLLLLAFAIPPARAARADEMRLLATSAAALPSGAAIQEAYAKYVEPVLDFLADFWPHLGIVALILFVGWEVPIFAIHQQAKADDKLAWLHQTRVEKWGLVGYLGYWRIRWRHRKGEESSAFFESESLKPKNPGRRKTGSLLSRKKSSEAACPSCSNALDNLGDYEADLRFNRCPHCGTEIEPRFSFSVYIGEVERELSEAAGKGKRKRRRSSDDLAESQVMSRLLRGMYHMACHYRATDIHIERTEHGASVQFRVDGMLGDAFEVPRSLAAPFLSSIKVQAALDITNHTTPQDGRYQMKIGATNYDVRINCAPTTSSGEILFMRLLDKRNVELKPADLGFQGKNLEYFEEAIRRPHGLILVTGPTGSGKSTTLYVALNQINTGERNIVTIEDPVEYQIPGLKQMQVMPEKKFTFATGLRSMLRQDPDVIMVGEIRDQETANMAVDAASTGHLVFTTLHTMDTTGAISRLNDLGVPSKRYSSALELIAAQRLVRVVCADCKQPYQPSEEELTRLGVTRIKKTIQFVRGQGCPTCNYTGYYGRRVILEMLRPAEEMRSLLEHETRPQVLKDYARRNGMRTLREEGILAAVAGKTTIEEIIRTTL